MGLRETYGREARALTLGLCCPTLKSNCEGALPFLRVCLGSGQPGHWTAKSPTWKCLWRMKKQGVVFGWKLYRCAELWVRMARTRSFPLSTFGRATSMTKTSDLSTSEDGELQR